jgi:hypothetical protein
MQTLFKSLAFPENNIALARPKEMTQFHIMVFFKQLETLLDVREQC